MTQIKFPSIYSDDIKEKEMAKVALNLKIDFSKGKLSKEEIEQAESIPGWSWELSAEENNFTKQNNINKKGN